MSKFDLATFIQHSNLIDPQEDSMGCVIPGAYPGDPMFDNMKNAWDVELYYAHDVDVLPRSYSQDVHRELTRGIEAFEQYGASGVYRKTQPRIGGRLTPPNYVVKKLMEEAWLPELNTLRSSSTLQAVNEPWWVIHDFFEWIHPFADGNGRTGRLHMNGFRVSAGLQPIVVHHEDRFKYYDNIKMFCNTKLPSILNKNGYSSF